MTEREAAVSVLLAVLERGQFLKDALDGVVGSKRLDGTRGYGYLWKVTRGVTERTMTIDAILGTFSAKSIKRMHPTVRTILRLGTYEILYMDSIPESASVNECVGLTKKYRQPRAGGLVNALLRKVSRVSHPEELYADWDLSTRYSMPQWITDGWQKRFGKEVTERMLRAFLEESPLTIRVRTGRISMEALQERFEKESIECQRLKGLPDALLILTHGAPDKLPGFSEGLFYVQDSASMRVCHMAEIHKNEQVLDVCASPGGKAFHAADLVGDGGSVLARDVSIDKVSRLIENQQRGGYENVRTEVWDATVFDHHSFQRFDVVLADVPCSGLGVLSRKPEIKYRLKQEDIHDLKLLSGRILDTVNGYVKTGGRMVFSTCTVCSDENEEQIRSFLHKYPDFSILCEKQFLPGERKTGNDGFYICVLRKNG